MNFATSLLELIPHQIAVYTRFLNLLHEEQGALTQSQSVQLETCTAERTNLVLALEKYDVEMRTLFISAKITFSSKGMRQFLNSIAEPHRSALERQWQQLLDIATECKKQNAVNSKIVDTRRQHTERVLRILMGQGTLTGTTYAADGRVQSATTPATLATA